jgi:hypothetical protein
MTENAKAEVWLRGPIQGVPAHLQPIAHGLLQCSEEIRHTIDGLASHQLTARPGGAASVSFHVRHAMGSLDRLFTYARGEQLSEAQRATLASEKEPDDPAITAASLADSFDRAVERAISELQGIDEKILLEPRRVGRAGLPSTVIGLLSHAAEHTARHTGQVVTTSKFVRGDGAASR